MEDGELVLSRCNGVAMWKMRTSYCIGMKEWLDPNLKVPQGQEVRGCPYMLEWRKPRRWIDFVTSPSPTSVGLENVKYNMTIRKQLGKAEG